MTLLTAITLSVVVQWLFGKCKRRNRTQSTPVETPQEEESEDFEIVSEPQEANEATIQEAVEAATEEVAEAEATQEGEVQETEAIEEEESTPEEPSSSSTAYQMHVGRKLYVTTYGEKYHLNRRCQGLKGYRAYEKEAGYCCLQDSQRVLVFNQSQPTPQSDTELSFNSTEFYHHKGCTQFYGSRRSRPVCIFCEDEERVLNYARNRTPATGSRNN